MFMKNEWEAENASNQTLNSNILRPKHIPLPLKYTYSFLYEARSLIYSFNKEHWNTLNIKPSSKQNGFGHKGQRRDW